MHEGKTCPVEDGGSMACGDRGGLVGIGGACLDVLMKINESNRC